MKSRIAKASLQNMATNTVLLPLFVVSLTASGFVLSSNANERKTAIITFDVRGARTGAFQSAVGLAISPEFRQHCRWGQ